MRLRSGRIRELLVVEREAAIVTHISIELLTHLGKSPTDAAGPAVFNTQSFPRGCFLAFWTFCAHLDLPGMMPEDSREATKGTKRHIAPLGKGAVCKTARPDLT